MIIVHVRHAFVLALLIYTSSSIFAQDNRDLSNDSLGFEAMQIVDDSVLEKIRGGFISPEGITFDIGVGKAIYLDGVLQLQNTFAANNIHFNGHNISAGNLQNMTSDVKSLIQNNIDNKTIQNFTVLDVNVKNFGGLMESMKGIQDIRAVQEIQAAR